MKRFLIKAPSQLDRHLRGIISDAVSRSLTTIGDEEYLYIGERVQAKLEALHQSSTHWVRSLWHVTAALHWALRDHSEGNCELSDSSRRLIAVALHYLINPFDVIPDHIPSQGYLDDALVMNYCIMEIHRENSDVLLRYMRKVSRLSREIACP
jgi:uncharacterized membrane protein YkvA (DUF1232 family)